MPEAPGYYSEGPEALVVSLATRGDRDAFAELVRRRQPWIRNLMRRLCGSAELADDLAQHVFLLAWRKIRQLRQPERFGAWLKRIAINEWMQHDRKRTPDWVSDIDELPLPARALSVDEAIDLDRALDELPGPVRLCIVLNYHERMSHGEIAESTGMQLGTVKSHIRRGSKRLRERLSAYGEPA